MDNEETPTLQHRALSREVVDAEIQRQLAAGAAAARSSAATSIAAAAKNAAKPGARSSEFKVAVAGLVVTAAAAAFDATPWAALLGPWAVPVVVFGSTILGGLYAISRGGVKKAALQSGELLTATPNATDD